MARQHPSNVGRCTRFLPLQQKLCRKSARYLVFGGAQALCKECYARFRAGKETLFNPGIPPTVRDWWEVRCRLAADVPERRRR